MQSINRLSIVIEPLIVGYLHTPFNLNLLPMVSFLTLPRGAAAVRSPPLRSSGN